jgi:DNA-directed RNA polymerase specialized sigma24 family protein
MARTDELVGHTRRRPHAFGDIVRRYQQFVFNAIYHYLGPKKEIEDVVQEVFIKSRL